MKVRMSWTHPLVTLPVLVDHLVTFFGILSQCKKSTIRDWTDIDLDQALQWGDYIATV